MDRYAGWIRLQDHPPTAQDADVQGCVVVWHVYNGAMIMAWQLVAQHGTVTHWMPTPQPPEA